MKHNILKRGLIFTLLLTLIFSSTCFAYADEQTKWVPKASMNDARVIFQTVAYNGAIYAIGGYNGSTLSTVEKYDPKSNTWNRTKSAMSAARHCFKAVVLNDKIYAFGGFGSGGNLASMEEYDPANDTWTPKSSMHTARQSLEAVVLDGKIYAIGGHGGQSATEVYDPSKDTWTPLQSMGTDRYLSQVVVLNGKIYAIGGYGSGGILASMEEYDPTSGVWVPQKPMNVPRAAFQTAVIAGKIYAFGGCNSSEAAISSIEVYDPSTNIWTLQKTSMSNPRYKFQAEVVNGEIYAIGGFDGNGGISSVEKYNPTTNQWTNELSLNTPRGYMNSEVIDGKIYAIGGTSVSPGSGCSITGGNTALSSVEELTAGQSSETLTVTASPNKVKINQEFTTNIAIHNETNICAEDMKITYDTSLFTYEGAVGQTGTKIYKEDTSTPGTIRFITACQGKDTAATGDKGLITLKFKAKAKGTGKVDIIKGRIADNATLEKDVDDANCGEDTITVDGYSDVNRSGSYTLLDLGIDAWYDGMNAADTDSTRFDADVITDGKIDDNDLTKITQEILANTDYVPNK